MHQRPFMGASGKPQYAKHSLQSLPSQMHQRINRPVQQPQRPVLQQLRASPGPSTDDAVPAPQQQLSAADKDSLLQQLELLRRSAVLIHPLCDYVTGMLDHSAVEQLPTSGPSLTAKSLVSAGSCSKNSTCPKHILLWVCCRQLDEAVAQEDYSRAKQLKERTDVSWPQPVYPCLWCGCLQQHNAPACTRCLRLSRPPSPLALLSLVRLARPKRVSAAAANMLWQTRAALPITYSL